MTIYIGSPGRMVNLPNIETQDMTPSETLSFETTLEGRVKAQRIPASRRKWSLGARMYRPTELGILESFARGSWGNGPFWFVPAEAPVVNLLPPDVAACDLDAISRSEPVAGGPWETPLGWAAQSIVSPGVIFYFDVNIPVLPGQPVTGSAVVQGVNAGLRLAWYNESGLISFIDGPKVDGTARAHVTGTPPVGASYVRLGVLTPVQRVAFPAVTWTDQPFEWGDGQGCEKAVVLGVSRELVKALRDVPDDGKWTTIGFTVQEVG